MPEGNTSKSSIGSIIPDPKFLYRCADLLCRIADKMEKDKRLLTPELVLKENAQFGLKLSSDEIKGLARVLELLSLMMQTLIVTRDSVIEQLTARVVDLEFRIRKLRET